MKQILDSYRPNHAVCIKAFSSLPNLDSNHGHKAS